MKRLLQNEFKKDYEKELNKLNKFKFIYDKLNQKNLVPSTLYKMMFN